MKMTMKQVGTKGKKLQLAKETLRSLSSGELERVGGATGTGCIVINPGTDAAATCPVGSSVRGGLASSEPARCLSLGTTATIGISPSILFP